MLHGVVIKLKGRKVKHYAPARLDRDEQYIYVWSDSTDPDLRSLLLVAKIELVEYAYFEVLVNGRDGQKEA